MRRTSGCGPIRNSFVAVVFALLSCGSAIAQSPTPTPPPVPAPPVVRAADRYLDQGNGRTADELVKFALANNTELAALRKEAESAEALIRQARLRANPSLEVSGSRQIGGADNSLMVEGALPLELGGRRNARIRVAERELEIRRFAVAERERQLAFEVRSKFGDALAAVHKLQFVEDTLIDAVENVNLVAAMVLEGRRPPLEQNQETVELNRMRVEREMRESAVEQRMFELRNLVGLAPEEPLRIRGEFNGGLADVPPQVTATEQAIERRPDLSGARAVELLAEARIQQARAEGRFDADLMLGYQRMQIGFHPLLGIEPGTGALLPIENKMHFFSFGVRLSIPVRNRNQGMIAAAQSEREAARNRREFGELTIKREVASAYARYSRAVRAREIYRVGVRNQAAANLDVIRQTYEIGTKTLMDYIAEHHRFTEVENGYVDAQLEAYLARLDVLRAVNSPELINK